MRRIFALLLIMIMVLSLVACGEKKEEAPVGGEAQQQPKAKDWPSEVVIVSGTTGGTSYYIGAGQAQILTEAIDGVSFVTEATNAAVTQNGPLVQGDASIMGHFVISALMQAREGTYPGLDAKLDKIYLIQVGNSTRPQFITLKENKINDFSDLKGKKIGVPPVTTVVYVATMQVLAAYGYEESDFASITPMAFNDQGDALKDGSIDVAVVAGGFPQAVASDLNSSRDIVMLSISDEAMAKVLAETPAYNAEIVPAGTYSDVDYDVQVVSIPQSIGCNIDMDEELVYEITKALNERTDELAAIHSEGSAWNLENSLAAYKAGAVPFHPGAARYYDEMISAGK
jgi:TRAP transporter TAXI family solute receptor